VLDRLPPQGTDYSDAAVGNSGSTECPLAFAPQQTAEANTCLHSKNSSHIPSYEFSTWPLTAIINAMLIFILVALSAASRSVDVDIVLASAWRNFQIGALIGLGIAVGIEIAKYTLTVKSFREFIEGPQQRRTPGEVKRNGQEPT